MFRIRRIYDTLNPINEEIIKEVQKIIIEQFPLINKKELKKLPEQLMNPLKYQFRSILFVADNEKGDISGFALLLHAPDLNFAYLDFISSEKKVSGRGIGGALYERIREEAILLKVDALLFECLPDDASLCKDKILLKQNKDRLKFYESYGARPVINTKYETPLDENDDNPPYIVIDYLDQQKELKKDHFRIIIKAILERKYSNILKKEYIDMVVNSINDDPIHLRPFKYLKNNPIKSVNLSVPEDKLIVLVYNDKHEIHHVKDRGYVESPIRIKSILSSLNKTGLFKILPAKYFSDSYIKEIHDIEYLNYFKKVCSVLDEKESVYPYVFPIRNNTKPPKDLPMRAGYYCIDTFTPLNKNAYLAARKAVNCVLTAAKSILEGSFLAYALVRPPGHHAEQKVFGGFCYFNSTAIAANYLRKKGKVAILDIDYHHGNGQQSIFYDRNDILTISIHGHPSFAYPFFSGFSHEKGEGEGKGYNINYPLPQKITDDRYIETLKKAILKINKFKPKFLVVAFGIDTAKGDPTGSWPLEADDFFKIGKLIGSLPYSTLIVQEGGYNTKTIGKNASYFFKGIWDGSFK